MTVCLGLNRFVPCCVLGHFHSIMQASGKPVVNIKHRLGDQCASGYLFAHIAIKKQIHLQFVRESSGKPIITFPV